ncbi:MAG: hypothetical protein R2747_08445 [Pyrinomonadaceae bacterium]
MKKIFVIVLIMIFALTALADQAAYITEKQAKEAVELLKDKGEIKHYCAPCEDKSIRLEAIEAIEAAPAGYENYWEVKVNGDGIDLAYVYFKNKKGKWKNVAKELDIKVSDVPKYLPDEDDGE